MKIAVFGGSGFVGSHLTSFLKQLGHEVINFSRTPSSPYFWDPENGRLDPNLLEKCDVVINLSGENIFGRWNENKKKKIRSSRIQSTKLIVDTLLKLSEPPTLYIGASAVGFYGDRGDEILTEESLPGHGFLSDLCVNWEALPKKLEEKNIRIVMARFGTVLGKDGGAFTKLNPLFKMGLGGTLGSGQQFFSWIHLQDLISAIYFIIQNKNLKGPINLVAPKPVTNEEMTKTLGKVLKRPSLLNVPEPVIKLLFSSGSEVYLNSERAIPEKLQKERFPFQFPTIEEAFQNIID